MRFLVKVFLVLWLVVFHVQAVAAQQSVKLEDFTGFRQESMDLSALFGDLKGTAVYLKPSTQKIMLYNKDLAEQRFSPFSTFKIVSAMLGLKYGVVKNAQSTLQYNGTTYWLPAWNKNVTFKEAFQSSCVWYFRQLIDEIPEKQVEEYLRALQYGNADVSAWQGNGSNALKELNGFWLNSSLRISALEQVKVMHHLFYMASPYPKADRELVEDFMHVGHGSVYGKTGSDGKGQSWFVGFVKKGLYKDYFAFYVQNAKDSAPHAKNIALKFFEQQ